MKTVIVIEDGKVTISVDDQAPVIVGTPLPTPDMLQRAEYLEKERAMIERADGVADCKYCKLRGGPCMRHGGTPGTIYGNKTA